MNKMIIKGKMPWSLIKFFLYLFIFIYVITSTIWCGTHNRARLQFKCVLTDNPPSPGKLATPPGSKSPTLFEQWCGFFYVPQEPDKWKCCETGPTVFRPYPRRLESLTVCRCRCIGSIFFSVIQRPWGLVRSGIEPATTRLADRRSPNRADRVAVVTVEPR